MTSRIDRSAMIAAGAVALAVSKAASEPEPEDEFLAKIQSDDAEVRYKAWISADQQDPSVIQPLGRLLTAENPGVAQAAGEAITTIVHSVGKSVDNPKRKDVTAQLAGLLERDDLATQTFALRALSLVADGDAVPAIAAWIGNEALAEEVVFCLERIPGGEATDALIAGFQTASEDFKPRIIAALAHREADKVVETLASPLNSEKEDIAMAAMRALAKLGQKPEGDVSLPDYNALSEWHKIEFFDNMFRYAEIQVRKGGSDEEFHFYNGILGSEDRDIVQEHHRCAAIVGLAKLEHSEVVPSIVPALDDPAYTVRITAEQALTGLKGAMADEKLEEAAAKAEGELKEKLQAIREARKG